MTQAIALRTSPEASTDHGKIPLWCCTKALIARTWRMSSTVGCTEPVLSTARLAIFAALLNELRSGKPTVLVFEDVHWADAATLDLLKYLSRRIRSIPTLIVLSYRDDELDGRHALWSLLGNLPAEAVRRVALRPLTPAAVASLAGRAGRPPEGIHVQTGGNPFYVSELLASPPGSVPATDQAPPSDDGLPFRVHPATANSRHVITNRPNDNAPVALVSIFFMSRPSVPAEPDHRKGGGVDAAATRRCRPANR